MTPEADRPPRKPWFRAMRFGSGWGLPCAWQGWAVLAAWLAALAGGLALALRVRPAGLGAALAAALVLVLAVALLWVCSVKGQPPDGRK